TSIFTRWPPATPASLDTSPRSAPGFLQVTTEFVAHGGKELVGEPRLAARTEAFVERGRKHGHRDGGVDRGFGRPASCAGVGDLAGKIRERGILGQRRGGKIEQPRRNDAAAPPYFRDVAQVEIVSIELRVAQWRRFRVDRMLLLSDIRVAQNAH